jgi:putative PEP-CTERM system TPR-repeat lipoprotein
MNKIAIIASAVALALGVSACSEQKPLEQSLSDAKEYSEKRDFSSAVVELKNAVRISPKNPEARLALGKAYLQQGNYVFAEKELNKSLELGMKKSSMIIDFVIVKSKLNRVEEVYSLVEQNLELEDGKFLILLTYAGITALHENNVDKAQDYFEQAISISEGSAYRQLASAYLFHSRSDFESGLKQIEEALALSPDILEALLLKGHLLFSLKKYNESTEAFQEYIKRRPLALHVKFFELNSLIYEKKIDEADLVVLDILKINKDMPLALQYKAQIEFTRKNYKEAKEFGAAAARQGRKYAAASIISGVSSYQIGDIEQAYNFLKPFESQLPQNHPASRVLSAVKLKLGYQIELTDDLMGMNQATIEDIDILLLSSFELLKNGDMNRAKILIDKIDDVDETFPSSQQNLQLGLLKLAMDDDEGIAILKEVLNQDPTSQEANLALIRAYLQSGNSEKAKSLALAWQKLIPNDVGPYDLLLKIYIEEGEEGLAKEVALKSLQLKEKSYAALMFLAARYLNYGDIAKALNMVDEALAIKPHNIAALSLNFVAQKELNQTALGLNRIKESFLLNEGDMNYRLFYAKSLIEEKHYSDIISLLGDLSLSTKNTPIAFWAFLGGSYSFLGDNQRALEVFNDWIDKKPSRIALFSKLSILDKLGDIPKALLAVKAILDTFPNDQQSKVMLPYYQVMNKQFTHAQHNINNLTESQKKLPIVRGLQGQIWLSQKNYLKAYPELLSAYQEIQSAKNSGLVYTSLLKMDKKNQAFDFMKHHVERHPNDIITKLFYAQLALELNLNVAKETYSELLNDRPNNVVFLNNLAWVELQLGNLISAAELAKKSLQIDDKQPNILDTLAMVRYKEGNRNEAIRLLEKAKKLSSNKNKEIEMHYRQVMSN